MSNTLMRLVSRIFSGWNWTPTFRICQTLIPPDSQWGVQISRYFLLYATGHSHVDTPSVVCILPRSRGWLDNHLPAWISIANTTASLTNLVAHFFFSQEQLMFMFFGLWMSQIEFEVGISCSWKELREFKDIRLTISDDPKISVRLWCDFSSQIQYHCSHRWV